jgi:glycosyltransferase involved in cell wall biosynthesis
MLYYLPLEHIDERYTVHLDRDIRAYLKRHKINYQVVEGVKQLANPTLNSANFLDAALTIANKSTQLTNLARYYAEGTMSNGDVIFTTDLWFPGIESIAYLNHFYGVDVKLRGVIHAGSFTDTDEVRRMERWAKGFEDVVFDIADKVYVATNFIRNDIIQKRTIDPAKVIVSGLPIDEIGLDAARLRNRDKERWCDIVFTGRNHADKQPHMITEMRKKFPDARISWTRTRYLSRDEYYDLLAQSKIIVSFAAQENFGYSIIEGMKLGCFPVVPNRLSYREIMQGVRYNTESECWQLIEAVLSGEVPSTYRPLPNISNNEVVLDCWFN